MSEKASLKLNGQEYEFDVVVGSEGEVGIDTLDVLAAAAVRFALAPRPLPA